MPDLDATLNERGSRYGDFSSHAELTQALKDFMKGAPKWHALAADQKECLEMIAHKIGRILNGDPNYADSWIDIAGYAQLVARRLERPQFVGAPQTVGVAVSRARMEEASHEELVRQMQEACSTNDLVRRPPR